MLALKALLAHRMELPTIIFDEIDTGVSGRIADAMGEIIADLSQTMQVVDITHLPQVASKGDTHFVVYKDAEGSHIRRLDPEERITEIAKNAIGQPNHGSRTRTGSYPAGQITDTSAHDHFHESNDPTPLFPVCQYLYKADYSLTQESTNFTDLQSRAMDFPSKPTVQAFRHRKSFRNGLPYPLWKFPFRKIRSKPFHPTPANKNISAYAVFYASVKSFSQRVRLMNRRVVKTDRICKKRN